MRGPGLSGDSCFVPAAAVAEQPGGNVAREGSVAKGECAAAVWEASQERAVRCLRVMGVGKERGAEKMRRGSVLLQHGGGGT